MCRSSLWQPHFDSDMGVADAPRRGRPAKAAVVKRGPGRPPKKTRTMSAEARAKFSAAQKARWAKQKRTQNKLRPAQPADRHRYSGTALLHRERRAVRPRFPIVPQKPGTSVPKLRLQGLRPVSGCRATWTSRKSWRDRSTTSWSRGTTPRLVNHGMRRPWRFSSALHQQSCAAARSPIRSSALLDTKSRSVRGRG